MAKAKKPTEEKEVKEAELVVESAPAAEETVTEAVETTETEETEAAEPKAWRYGLFGRSH